MEEIRYLYFTKEELDDAKTGICLNYTPHFKKLISSMPIVEIDGTTYYELSETKALDFSNCFHDVSNDEVFYAVNALYRSSFPGGLKGKPHNDTGIYRIYACDYASSFALVDAFFDEMFENPYVETLEDNIYAGQIYEDEWGDRYIVLGWNEAMEAWEMYEFPDEEVHAQRYFLSEDEFKDYKLINDIYNVEETK